MKLRNIFYTLGALLLGVFSLNAQDVTRFVVTEAGGNDPVGTTPLRSGFPVALRIRAVDAGGATVSSYNSTVSLRFAEPRLNDVWWVSATATLTSGVADNVIVTPIHAGSGDRRIAVSDGNIATYNASGTFSIRPYGFLVTAAGSDVRLGSITQTYVTGANLDVRVQALNFDGTLAESYQGAVTLSSASATFADTTVLFTGITNGSVDVLGGITLTAAAEADSISVTDGFVSTSNATGTYDGNGTFAPGTFNVRAPGTGTNAERLVISNVGSTTTYYPGQAATVRWTATNPKSGTRPTNNSEGVLPTPVTGPIDFTISVQDGADTFIGTFVYRYSGSIAGNYDEGTSVTLTSSIVVPDYATTGEFTIKVTAVQTGEGTITVAGLPDLQITRLDYTPGEYRGGDALRFDMTWLNRLISNTRNNARVPADSGAFYRVEIHLSVNGTFGDSDDFLVWQGTYVGNGLGQDLLRGRHVSVQDAFLLPKNAPGSYYLLAKINSAGGRDGNFSTGFTEEIGPTPGSILMDGNNIVVPSESAKITLLPEEGPETTRVSLADDESESAGVSDRPVLSDDGRFVVFHSYGALAGTTTANVANVFIRDTLLENTTLLSPGSFNGGANGHNLYPRTTSDAGYVVFQSDATNLMPGDTNGFTDIFIRDVAKGSTIRLLAPGNGQTNRSSFLPDISADGRFIVFESTATNLVPGVAINGVRQIFLYDRDVAGTGTLDVLGNTSYTLISKTSAGIAGNGVSSTPRISRDGAYVVFTTRASNLVSGSTSFTQVVRWSRSSGAIVTVSATTAGTLANGDAGFPVINRDGAYVVYASRAKNLTSDTYAVGIPHLFRARITNGAVAAVVRINGASGVEPNNPIYGWVNEPDLGSFEPAISDDGQTVAFVSESTNLLPPVAVRHIDRTEYESSVVQNYEDRTEASDVYVADLSSPTAPSIYRASVSSLGFESTAWGVGGLTTTAVVQHRSPAMSGDGGYIAFSSDAKGHSGLVFGATNFDYVATNAVKDVYLFNAKTGLPTTPTDRPVVNLVLPAANVEVFESQTITIAAEIVSAVRSIAQVEFYADGNLIGTVTSPTTTGGRRYEFAWDISTLGLLVTRSYALSVVAVDSGGLRSDVTGSVVATAKINTAPTIAVTSPVSGSFVSTGKDVTIYANASDPDGTVSTVEFFANGTSIGSSTTTPHKIVWTPGVAGDYILTASATDNLSAVSVTPWPVNVFAAFQVRPSPMLDDSQFIDSVYSDLLDRTPASLEYDDAIARFGADTVSRAQFLVEMEAMPEFTTRLEFLTAYKIVMGAWPTRDELQTAISAVTGSGETADDDHGDTPLSATTVTQSTTSGRIEETGDADFFRINVTVDGAFSISTSGSMDTVGTLYDASGNIIAEDDDSGDGLNFSFTRSLTVGTYYVSVEGWLGLIRGSYQLRVAGPGITSSGFVASTDVQLSAFITALFNSTAYQNKYGTLPSLATATNRVALFTQFFVNNYSAQPTDQQKLEGSTNLNSLGSAATYVSYMVQGTKISGRDLVYNAPDVRMHHLSAALIAGLQQIRPVAADVQPLAGMTALQAAQAIIDDVDYVNRYITVDNPPLAQTIDVGGTFRLTVDARGAQPFTYQWYRNGAPLSGATSQFLTMSNATSLLSGYYSVEITNPNGSIFSPPALLTVGTNTSRLVNLSTRAPVGSGEQTMIAGFVVSGSEPRQMLIRAAGPALAASFGLGGVLADPTLTLFQGSAPIASNDNWSSDTAQANAIASAGANVGAFTFKDGSKDAALLVTLQPGLYTAQVTGADGGSGIGLVEVYDLGASLATRAVNVSTRAAVQSGGDEIVIAGFVINGTSPRKVLVRAVGPALASYGVSSVLSNPRLTIHRQGDGAILYRNDDWAAGTDAAGIAAAAAQVGAFELTAGSKDAAMVVTLAPGLYTAQATSENGGTGVVLVEVYDLEN